MIRLNIIVEGQTEETFVHQILSPYLALQEIYISVRCVETGRSKEKINRGGLSKYAKARNDLLRWMKEDKQAWYTTMFDLYGLPADFPGMDNHLLNMYEKVDLIEVGIFNDINANMDARKFIPYIQLHEFEAILLSEPIKFNYYFIDDEHSKTISRLISICETFETPEHINQGVDTAPSKRIITLFPEYHGLKTTAGPLIANEIGLNTIRKKCKHFSDWITKLEKLNADQS